MTTPNDDSFSRLQPRLAAVLSRRDELSALLATAPEAGRLTKLAKEYAELQPVAEGIETVAAVRRALDEAESLRDDPASDPDLRTMAADEVKALTLKLAEVQRAVQRALLPRDEADAGDAILEVRAGTGGEEAALFAALLFRMYQRYAGLRGWRFEVLSSAETDLGGTKEAIASIAGADVFARLKFESGVHRVQRVPETESSGRIHTSAATVAVLPSAEDIDVAIADKDLRIDTYRSQGAGGQHVNTTDSAVRITHLPSGLVVACQDEKSQHKNRAKAMKILRARLYEQQRQARDDARAADRRGQIGSGDRSERIRTYNFPQGRVTDHRINLTLYKIDAVVGGEALDEVIEALVTADEAERLASLS